MTTTGMDARQAAETLARHRALSRALPAFPGPVPDTLDAAYRIQAAAIEQWGRPIAGWKVGLVSRELAERFGDSRFIGPIFSDSVVHAARGDIASFRAIPGGTALAEAELVAVVEQSGNKCYRTARWHLGIEVAGSPVANIGALGSLASIAAFGNNVGLILGPPVSLADPSEVACTVEIDGIETGSYTAARLPGGPAAAVDFAIATLARLGIARSSSILISTGAITGMHPVAPGQLIGARFDPGGCVEARVVAAA